MDEALFWDSTMAEIERYLNSFKRRKEREQKERASFDYILADLIGVSVARVQSKRVSYPKISQVYPTLFPEEEIEESEQNKRDKLTVNRFLQFAQSFNKRFKEVNSEDGRRING